MRGGTATAIPPTAAPRESHARRHIGFKGLSIVREFSLVDTPGPRLYEEWECCTCLLYEKVLHPV
jgi:hypothetical protein